MNQISNTKLFLFKLWQLLLLRYLIGIYLVKWEKYISFFFFNAAHMQVNKAEVGGCAFYNSEKPL